MDELKITRSNGNGKGGKTFYYVRPIYDCFNRSRKVSGFTYREIHEKLDKLIETWYSPKIILYEIQGHTIASNSKENALKEFWRVCELTDVKKPFEVKQK